MESLLTSSTVNKSSLSLSWQTILGIVNGLSVFVKCLSVSLCVGYLLSFSGTMFDLLTVSPGKLMPPNFWIWTILTHSLVEVCIVFVFIPNPNRKPHIIDLVDTVTTTSPAHPNNCD